MKSVLIRADASLKIGSGHVMRCLTLAKELRKRGTKVHFICRDIPGNLSGAIKNNNFDLTLISSMKSCDPIDVWSKAKTASTIF